MVLLVGWEPSPWEALPAFCPTVKAICGVSVCVLEPLLAAAHQTTQGVNVVRPRQAGHGMHSAVGCASESLAGYCAFRCFSTGMRGVAQGMPACACCSELESGSDGGVSVMAIAQCNA